MACIRKRRNRWVVDFRDQFGTRRWESYRTREEAKLALEARLKQVRTGTYRAPSRMPPLREVAEAWLRSKADRRPSTRYLWQNHVHVHILPRLGDVRVDRITPQVIEESLRNDLLRGGRLAPQTINKILGTLTAVFEYAERHGITERNPARLAERLRPGGGEVAAGEADAQGERQVDPDDVPSPEEVRRLLMAAEPGLSSTFLLTAALTGARCSELLALTWDDVELDRGEIHIRRAISWARTREDRAAGVTGARFFAPKTKSSRRKVEAPPELVTALRRWKLAAPISETGLVFAKADGTPIHRKTIRDKYLIPALDRAGLRRFGVHALRHFFASELIRRGYPVTEVAARLGHSSPAVTMAVYARWFTNAKSDAVKELAKSLCAS